MQDNVPTLLGKTRIDGATVPRSDWDRAPWNRWSFQHVRELLPTAPVWRGAEKPTDLPKDLQDFGEISFELDGVRHSVNSVLDASFTDGFLVLHRGKVVTEIYSNGMMPQTPHLAQSVSKSIVGATCGILVGKGLVDPDAPITSVLPELAQTAYRGATIRHLLDMSSGVTFEEDYTATNSHMAQLDSASGWKAATDPAWPGSVWDLILRLTEAESDHGQTFSYRSIETDVLAFVLQRITGSSLAELISQELWSQIGAEEDAYFTVDPTGYALADGGFNACLRDFGRFALLHLNDGVTGRGKRLLHSDWIADTRAGSPSEFGALYTGILPDGSYRNQFWIEDQDRRALLARGVFGQLIYIDPESDFAAVKLSSWPEFVSHDRTRITLAAVHAIKASLR